MNGYYLEEHTMPEDCSSCSSFGKDSIGFYLIVTPKISWWRGELDNKSALCWCVFHGYMFNDQRALSFIFVLPYLWNIKFLLYQKNF